MGVSYMPEKKIAVTVRSRPPKFHGDRIRTEEERNDLIEYYGREVGVIHREDGRIVFGLLIGDEIGYMCYYMDEYLTNRMASGGMIFDAGTTMPEIYVSAPEMRKALTELGLFPWKETHSNA